MEWPFLWRASRCVLKMMVLHWRVLDREDQLNYPPPSRSLPSIPLCATSFSSVLTRMVVLSVVVEQRLVAASPKSLLPSASSVAAAHLIRTTSGHGESRTMEQSVLWCASQSVLMMVLRWRVPFILCRPDHHHRIHCARPPPLSTQDGGIELHRRASRWVAASPRGHHCRRHLPWRFAQWVVLCSGGSWNDQSSVASARVCLKEWWCAG